MGDMVTLKYIGRGGQSSLMKAFSPNAMRMEIIQVVFGTVRRAYWQHTAIAGDYVRVIDEEPLAGSLLAIAGYMGPARIFRFEGRRDDHLIMMEVSEEEIVGLQSIAQAASTDPLDDIVPF